MKTLARNAIDTAVKRGADYADIRVMEMRNENIRVRNGQLGALDLSEQIGFGVRVLADGAWGFASSSILTETEVARVAAEAVRIAKASATVRGETVKLAPEKPHVETWQTPILEDPFAVSLDDKLALLVEIDRILRQKPEIKRAEGSMSFRRDHILFVSSEGAEIYQELIRSGAGYACTAVGHGEVQRRSFPLGFGGQYKACGYELVRSLRLVENAERIREEAIALLTAPPCPTGRFDVVIGRGQMHLQIHESVGHPSELDRVLGMEENYAGSSFATIDKYKKFQYGSDIVNLVADGTVPHGLATRGFDDDGVRQERFHIVHQGLLTGYMTSREFYHQCGDDKSHGCNRAEGFWAVPIVRINNLSLLPGEWEFDDLLADTDGGIFLDDNSSWSIDQRRLNFQFGCEIAYEIKGGKLGQLYKNANYQGITPEFWNACDAICNAKHWELMGVPNCGKGEPGQRAEMSHGCSPARFRNVQLGIEPQT